MRYLIKEAFQLNSHQPSPLLLQRGQYYVTEDEAEVEELAVFAEDGSCEELELVKKEEVEEEPGEPEAEVEEAAEEDEEEPEDPEEDITVVPGVGKKLKKELAGLEKPVTTISELKDRVGDEVVQEVLGGQYEKVVAYFAE